VNKLKSERSRLAKTRKRLLLSRRSSQFAEGDSQQQTYRLAVVAKVHQDNQIETDSQQQHHVLQRK
jgi:hypothetical protein